MGISRAENMSRIRGTNTKPEVLLQEALAERGLVGDPHGKTPKGRPDVVFTKEKVAVFIDGCFWHGCPEHYVRPRSRHEFWSEKLEENIQRDRRQTLALEEAGWRVFRFWEHEVFTELDRVVGEVLVARRLEGWTPSPREVVWKVETLDEAGNQERRHLQLLRAPEVVRVVEQTRHTRKWKKAELTLPR